MWALIFRSHQMRNMADTETKARMMLTTTVMMVKRGTIHGMPHASNSP